MHTCVHYKTILFFLSAFLYVRLTISAYVFLVFVNACSLEYYVLFPMNLQKLNNINAWSSTCVNNCFPTDLFVNTFALNLVL